jgi:uncharacterized protein (DUF39 family)
MLRRMREAGISQSARRVDVVVLMAMGVMVDCGVDALRAECSELVRRTIMLRAG